MRSFWLSLVGVAAIGLMGCGGGAGSGGDAGIASASGVVTLPSGSTITPGSLTISSASGGVAVGANGAFTVTEPAGGGPATVVVTDKNGNLILLGHVDTNNPAFNEVDVVSTAEELLFLSTLSFTLPMEQWTQVYALLAAAPETMTLANVISARIVASPTAVGDQDAQIQAAVSTATTSLLSTGSTPGQPVDGGATDAAASDVAPFDALPSDGHSSNRTAAIAAFPPDASSFSRRVGALTGSSPLVSVAVKSANPYGLSVQGSLDNLGIYIENSKRIHRHYFVFRSGYVSSTGQSTDPPTPLATWVQVADGDLSAVTGVTGIVSSLIDYWDGKIAWTPMDTPTIPLPLDPSDAKANAFKVYVVGAGSAGPVDSSGHQAPPADLVSLQPNQVPAITAAARSAAYLELLKEMIWPLLTKIVPIGALGNISDTAWATFATSFSQELTSLGLDLDPDIVNGNLKGAAAAVISAITSNPKVKAAVFKQMYDFLAAQSVVATANGFVNTWASIFKNVVTYLNFFDKFLATTDVGSAVYQASQSNMYNSWDLTAVPTKVQIKPNPAQVGDTGTVSLTATPMSPMGTSAYSYLWSNTATAGTLSGSGSTNMMPVATGGTSYCSSDSSTLYAENTNNGGAMGMDTVTVAVYATPNCQGTLIGNDTDTVTVPPSNVTLMVSPTTIIGIGSSTLTATVKGTQDGGVDGGPALSYDFSCPLTGCPIGMLRDAEGMTGSDVCSNSAQALYQQMSLVSTPMTQVNFLARVYDAPGCAPGGGMLVGSAPGSVTVVNPVTLTAQPPMIDLGGSSDLTASVMPIGGPVGGVDGGATLSYDFSCPTCTAGGLRPAGGGATTAGPLCSETNQVTYVPNANVTQTTKDGVSVTVYNAPGCSTGTGMAVGTASTPVTVTVDKMDAGSSAGTGTFLVGGATCSFSGSTEAYAVTAGASGWQVVLNSPDCVGGFSWTGNGTGTFQCATTESQGPAGCGGGGSWLVQDAGPTCTVTITSFGSNIGDRVVGSMSTSGSEAFGSASNVSSADGFICPDLHSNIKGPPLFATFDVVLAR
jgi:hypothetical protein